MSRIKVVGYINTDSGDFDAHLDPDSDTGLSADGYQAMTTYEGSDLVTLADLEDLELAVEE